MTTPLEAALTYAAFDGYRVLPCTAKKIPINIECLFEHGFASATTDTAVISKAWTKYKAADIGLAPPHGVGPPTPHNLAYYRTTRGSCASQQNTPAYVG